MTRKPNIWVFSLEPLETRYTIEWLHGIPNALYERDVNQEFNIINVLGQQVVSEVSTGGFLNFGDTNYWKSSQLIEFLKRYNNGEVGDNDIFLITDFWNTTAVQIRYMANLMGKNWKIHGICHAGKYDPADFLGRMPGGEWATYQEATFLEVYDFLYFATEFHRDLYLKGISSVVVPTEKQLEKLVISGQPHEAMISQLVKVPPREKKDQVVFPHRISVEKQPEIFRDLAERMPDINFVVCQDTKLSKEQYHAVLAESKVVFSASLQETMGISTCMEGPLLGCLPFAPDRLSYSEVFRGYEAFLYDPKWTESWDAYVEHRDQVITALRGLVTNYSSLVEKLRHFNEERLSGYTSANVMYDKILFNS